MSLISNVSSFTSSFAAAQNAPQNGAGIDFDALLNSFDTDTTKTSQSSGYASGLLGDVNILAFAEGANSSDFINTLIGHLQNPSDASPSDAASSFSFTPEFQATFGNSGPLINWINVVTGGLGLSSEQNLALQNIAIEHKDTTGSQEDIAQIATELTAAGIQHA